LEKRNGVNISYLLHEDELKEYLDLNHLIRNIPFAGIHVLNLDVPLLLENIF